MGLYEYIVSSKRGFERHAKKYVFFQYFSVVIVFGRSGMSRHLVVWLESLAFDYRLIETDLKDTFSKFGEIVEVMLLDDKTAPDIAIIEFESSQSVKDAITAFDGKAQTVEGYTAITRAVEMTPAVERALLVKAHVISSSMEDNLIDPFDNYNSLNRYTCRYVVGADKMNSEYSVIGRIVGAGGDNVKGIFRQTGAHVRINGKQKSRDDPLHVRVSAETKEAFEAGRKMTEALIQEMYDDYAVWCDRHYIPVPPIRLRVVEGSETLRPLGRLVDYHFSCSRCPCVCKVIVPTRIATTVRFRRSIA